MADAYIGSEISSDNTPHILIVDDKEFNREILDRILANDYRTMGAEDGFEVLDLMKKHRFDLILLDIMMPRMDGIELLKKIREVTPSTDLPIILVSALKDKKDIVRGLQAGANDYIVKPVDISIVQARVKTHLHIKDAFDMQKKAVQKLEEADILKNKLLTIASHDLKVPLSNIFMAESLLRELSNLEDPTIVTILDNMKMTLKNMNQIIVEFLDMASLQSGTIDVDLEPVILDGVINSVIEQYNLSSKEKGSVIYSLTTEGVVLADSERLKQILSNLVSNALKYSPPNSEIKVNVLQNTDTFIIQVIDQGPGIPESEREQLFKEFGKLSPRPTGNESSTGLGLWIVKQMVELINGQVGVDCPESGGSIFWVELPALPVTMIT